MAATDDAAANLWTRQRRDPRPAAPYNTDPIDGANHAFDRESGEAIPPRWLESYARNLAQYHLHREQKFWGGEWTESGPLRRRHIHVAAVQHIGKEADRWEEQAYVGSEEDDQAIEYGLTAEARAGLVELIRSARVKFKLKRLAKAARISDNTITALLADGALPRDRVLIGVAEAVDRLENDAAAKDAQLARLLEWTRMRVDLDGLPAVAVRLRYDPANLRKVLLDNRRASKMLLGRMEFECDLDGARDSR